MIGDFGSTGRTRTWTAAGAMLGCLLAVLVTPIAGDAAGPAQTAGAGDPTPPCQQRTVTTGILEATGCFTADSSNQVFTSTGDIDLNGFTVSPGGKGADAGAAVVISTKSGYVTTNNKKVAFSAKPIDLGAIPLDFAVPSTGSVQLGNLVFSTQQTAPQVILNLIQSFGPNVSVPVSLQKDGGEIAMTVGLQGLFVLADKSKSVTIEVGVEPGKGAVFDGIELQASGIKLGPVELNDLEAKWRSDGTWSGSIEISFPLKGKDLDISGTIEFDKGKFKSVSVKVNGVHIPITGGLFLQNIGGSLGFNPVLLAAELDVIWGQTVHIFGHDVALFELDGTASLGNQGQTVFIKIAAAMKIIGAQVANGTFELFLGPQASGAYMSLSAGIGLPSFTNDSNQPTYIGIGLSGWIGVKGGRPAYDFEGNGQIKVIGINLVQADVVASDIGLAACWKVLWVPGGIGGRWGQPVQPFGVGCGIDAYKDPVPVATPASQQVKGAAQRSFRLADDAKIVRVRSKLFGRLGAREAPRFVLTDGKGNRIEPLPGAGTRSRFIDKKFFVSHDEDNGQTFVSIRKPKGTWTLTPVAGSPEIGSIQISREAPLPKNVRARITGSGSRRTIRWSSGALGAHQLEFEEVLPGGRRQNIFTTSKRSGSHSFTPAAGPAGARRLRVRIRHGLGMRDAKLVDGYRVSPDPLPGRPTYAAAERNATDVSVRFGPAARAARYEVTVATAGGRVRYIREVGPRASQVTLRKVGARGALIARVRAIGADGRFGQAVAARVATQPVPRNAADAARRTASSFELLASGRASARPECPAGGHCLVTVDVRAGGRSIGRARRTLFPGAADRIVMRLASAAGAAEVRVTVTQARRSTTRSARVEIGSLPNVAQVDRPKGRVTVATWRPGSLRARSPLHLRLYRGTQLLALGAAGAGEAGVRGVQLRLAPAGRRLRGRVAATLIASGRTRDGADYLSRRTLLVR